MAQQQTKQTRVIRVELDQNIRIVALNNMGSHFRVGDQCHVGYGGGNIASIVHDGRRGVLVIRKDCKFVDPQNKALGEFDALEIPMSRVVCAYAVDDEQEQQPAPQPQPQGKVK